MIKQGRRGHEVFEIIIHQTTTRPNWMADKSIEAKRDEIDRWHKERGWKGFGYHWLIDRDGKRIAGRPETDIGAGVRGRNRGRIHISLVGGHGASKADPFEQHFTPEQDASARELIDQIEDRANITKISGHDRYANKACPGFNVRKWIKVPVMPRTNVAQSTTVQVSGGQVLTGIGGFIAAITGLSGNAQIVALVLSTLLVCGGAYIMRERIVHWLEGVQ